jgi:hypothetical protein
METIRNKIPLKYQCQVWTMKCMDYVQNKWTINVSLNDEINIDYTINILISKLIESQGNEKD